MARVIGTATLKGPLSYTVHGVTFKRGTPTEVKSEGVWNAVNGNPFFDCAPGPEVKIRVGPGREAVPASALRPLPEPKATKKADDEELDAAELESDADEDDDEPVSEKPDKPKSSKKDKDKKKGKRKER